MNPLRGDLHIDGLLSNLSIGYLNKPGAFIAHKVFPVVPVNKQSDQYAIYNKGDFLRDEAKLRAPGTESAGNGFNMDDPATFFCPEYSFHINIHDDQYANADEVFDVDDDAVKLVTEKLLIRRERIWASNYFAASVWDNELNGVSGTPSTNQFKCWDLSGSTPITDIEDSKLLVKAATGLTPNTLVVSERVHATLKNHSDVLDRYKYTRPGVIVEDLLAKVFGVDNYLVSSSVYASSAEGATDTVGFICDQYSALLVYSAPNPSRWQPSGGYTFRWKRPMFTGRKSNRLEATIKRFRLDALDSVRIQGSIYEDYKVVATDCGVFFDDAIAVGRGLS